ncbi:MAG: hypothetical protein CSYNP_03965 [Syntrophus sp. SKADARSKE-3]|nr:hypothetical protein [Syntrophus sp. SKADARSKE-3]
MKITVSNIPLEGLDLRSSMSRGWLENAMTDQAVPCTCTRDIRVTIHVRRHGDNVFLEGSIVTALDLTCCRCLETAVFPIDVAFRYTMVPMPDEQAGEIELGSDDLEYGYYNEDTIDLEPLIFEQIVLQIPIKVLCREDCRGLCSRCGANLNQEPCRCEDTVDERFAVLKKLKIQKK